MILAVISPTTPYIFRSKYHRGGYEAIISNSNPRLSPGRRKTGIGVRGFRNWKLEIGKLPMDTVGQSDHEQVVGWEHASFKASPKDDRGRVETMNYGPSTTDPTWRANSTPISVGKIPNADADADAKLNINQPTNYAIQSPSRLSVCIRQSSSTSMVKVTLVSAGALVRWRGGTGLAPDHVFGRCLAPPSHLPHRKSSTAASLEQRSPSAHESNQGSIRMTPALPCVAEDG